MKHMFAALSLGLVLSANTVAADPAPSPRKLRLLILSGANTHDWKTTTPALQKMYEDSGRFVVKVTEDVPALNVGILAHFDAIVCNYTAYPKVDGQRLPAKTEKVLLDYIAVGRGFVLIHAASTAWSDWPEFGDLIGMTWEKDPGTGKDVSGHGDLHSFAVDITDPNHPITAGMKSFQHDTDELFHRQHLRPTAKVLATAFSSPQKNGSGANEPVAVVTERGKGRVFHCAMGHDVASMAGPGFQTLMLRGTEWAASGKVTLPIPNDLPPAVADPQAGKASGKPGTVPPSSVKP